VTTLFDKLEAGASFRRRLDHHRRSVRNDWRKVRRQDEGEGVQRGHLVFVCTLDLAFARFVHMGVIVMMPVQVRVDQRGVIVMIAITVNVLERRQNKGGHKRQATIEREYSSHQRHTSATTRLPTGGLSSLGALFEFRALATAHPGDIVRPFNPISEHTVARNSASGSHAADKITVCYREQTAEGKSSSH
jgi:hypothetical protein